MDPPPALASKRGAAGNGSKGSKTRRLGLKKIAPAPTPSLTAPSPTPSPTAATPSPTVPAPSPSPTAPAATSTPTAPAPPPIPTAPTCPLQGARWGSIPPNFAQDPNSWIYPPGGFLNLIGQNVAFNPFSPPHAANSNGTPSPQGIDQAIEEEISTNKTAKRNLRYWTHEEEERLASSWLEISKDPIHGNDKKGDTFWKEITSEFNRKGKGKRTREVNQLKVHWSRLKTAIGEWSDYWTKVTQMHTSGYSDDMLEEEAQKMYANRHGKNFTLLHWWKILKDEPKWCAQFETEKDKKDSSEIVDIPDAQKRPQGREAAKAERRGKRKKDDVKDGIVILGENIEKIVKVEEDRKMERDKVTTAQVQISNTNLKAAQEHKQAKMFEVYNSLITQDTVNMSEEAKAAREKAMRKLEEKLFAD